MSSKRAPPLPKTTLEDLDDQLLLRILCCLPPAQRRLLPSVCRRWRALCEGPGPLWDALYLDFSHGRIEHSAAMYKWLLARRGGVKGLTVVTETDEDWQSVHLVLGLVAGGLESLTVRAGYEGLGMCSVSWMAVLGQLKSLRLDFDRDHLIAAAEFPPGLESLVLRPSDLRVTLEAVPQGLSKLTRLTELQLARLNMADAAADSKENGWRRLLQLTALERLSIRTSKLPPLPDELSALARLTNLALPTCGESHKLLSSQGLAPLAALPQLAALDLRFCLLGELPPPVGSLPVLRTLLLRGNKLKAMPEGAYLSILEYLDLGANELEDLPPVLLGCSRLEVLDVIAEAPHAKLAAQDLRKLLSANPSLRQLSIGSASGLGANQLAKLRSAFPGVRLLEVDPNVVEEAGDGGFGGSGSDEDYPEEEEEWESSGSGEDEEGEEWMEEEEEAEEPDYPGSSREEEGEGREASSGGSE